MTSWFTANISLFLLADQAITANLIGSSDDVTADMGGIILPAGVWQISLDYRVSNVFEPDGHTPTGTATTAEGVAVIVDAQTWPREIVALQGPVGTGSGSGLLSALGGSLLTLRGLDLTGGHGGCAITGCLLGWKVADLPADLEAILLD